MPDAERQRAPVGEMPTTAGIEHEGIEVVAAVVSQSKRDTRLTENRELSMQPEVPLHHHRDAIGVVLVIDAKTDADRVVDGADEAVVDQLDAAAKSKPDVVVIIERRRPWKGVSDS